MDKVPLEPDFWQRWSVVKPLGRGEFGQVLLIRNDTGQEVALKQFEKEGTEPKRELDIFRLLTKYGVSQSCGLLQYKGAVRAPLHRGRRNVLSLLIEYVPGENLRQAMPRNGYTVEQTREVLRQTLLQLVCLHDARLVHRDVKLENIIWDRRPGQQWPVRLIDYGFLCSTSETAEFASCAVQQGGTIGYHSPDALDALIRGQAYTATPEDDVWALGLVALRMRAPLAWKMPEEATREELQALQLRQEKLRAKLPRLNLGIPVIAKLLETLDYDRPTALEALEMLLE
jgi:serine/threonine protein kinase